MQITVNGDVYEIAADPDRSLLHVLREELSLTAAKYGCGEGVCGACTVLVDDQPVQSCVIALNDVVEKRVTTLEGLAGNSATKWLEASFAMGAAEQCGYCTAGMLVSATSLLRRESRPDRASIVVAMDGNICRCGTYARIERAIESAAAAGARPAAPRLQPPTVDRPLLRPRRPWDLTPAGERDWLDVLGPGLVVVLAPDVMAVLEELTGAGWSTPGGGWLHVDPAGRVTVFIGKVDVGQGNRRALARLAAAEFGAKLDSITVVMGDSDLDPYDLGTFGSRSMADAGTVVRLLAATARRAIDELGSPPREGCELRYATSDTQLAPDISTRLAKLEGAAPARPGSARYTSDMAMPGMHHGRVLRPPSRGARLKSLDATRAAAMTGVRVVRDGDFVGVTAPDAAVARLAIAAVEATWVEQAGQPSEPELAAYLRSHPTEPEGWEGNFDRSSGDPDRAFRSASRTFSATYSTAYLAHVPLEARVAVADIDADGRLTVWTGTQRPFAVRDQIADALEMAEEDIRVRVPPTGSGYGGKHSGEAAVEAARLARATGLPVKVRWSRGEEFAWSYLRPAAIIDVRSAVDGDGRLIGWEHVNVNSGANAISVPYEVPNTHLVYQAADSPLRQGSWRALAASANCFARESHIDEIAHELAVDPLDFRLRQLPDRRLAAVLRAAADRAGYGNNTPSANGARVGIGMACGIEKDGRIATVAQVAVGEDGAPRVERIVSAYDCGLIVDRDNLANQVEGAAVMGLGAALFEAIHFDGGHITNGSLAQYRLARFSDTPQVDVVLLDQPDEPPAGGGETPIIAIAPAIANAIYSATGRRLRSLPLLSSW